MYSKVQQVRWCYSDHRRKVVPVLGLSVGFCRKYNMLLAFYNSHHEENMYSNEEIFPLLDSHKIGSVRPSILPSVLPSVRKFSPDWLIRFF